MDLIGYGIGAAGVAVGVYGIAKSRRTKRISFETRSIPIVQDGINAIPELAVSFSGSPVVRLTATKMLILNTGKAVIRQEDVAPADPLRVVVDIPGKILKMSVAYKFGKANRVWVNQNGDGIVHFDYIAPREGCLLTFLHTAHGEARLSGTLIEGSTRKGRRLTPPGSLKMPYSMRFQLLCAAGALVALAGTLYGAKLLQLDTPKWAAVIAGALVAQLTTSLIVFTGWRRTGLGSEYWEAPDIKPSSENDSTK